MFTYQKIYSKSKYVIVVKIIKMVLHQVNDKSVVYQNN